MYLFSIQYWMTWQIFLSHGGIIRAFILYWAIYWQLYLISIGGTCVSRGVFWIHLSLVTWLQSSCLYLLAGTWESHISDKYRNDVNVQMSASNHWHVYSDDNYLAQVLESSRGYVDYVPVFLGYCVLNTCMWILWFIIFRKCIPFKLVCLSALHVLGIIVGKWID